MPGENRFVLIFDPAHAAAELQLQIFSRMSREQRLVQPTAPSDRLCDVANIGLRRRFSLVPESALKAVYKIYGISLPIRKKGFDHEAG